AGLRSKPEQGSRPACVSALAHCACPKPAKYCVHCPNWSRPRHRNGCPFTPPVYPGPGHNPTPPTAGGGPLSGRVRVLSRILQVGFDFALDLHRDRPPAAIQRLADGDPDPAFADAIFLDRGSLLAIEADTDAAGEKVGVVKGTPGIDRKPVG